MIRDGWGVPRALADSGETGFDLTAASLRADARDAATFLEVLAGKLEGALPGAVRIRRAGGLFAKRRRAQALEIDLGDWQFGLAAGPGGSPRAHRAHMVRGIALKSEEMPLDAWVSALLEALAAEARASATAAEALQRLL